MAAIFLGIAFACGLLARQLGMPPLVGFLVAGFALRALGHESSELLSTLAHLGVELLLFTVGLKIRLRNMAQPVVWAGALIHIGVMMAVIAPGIWLLFSLSLPVVLTLALALAFSSTVLAAKVLEDKHELRSFHGRVAIGILIVQDLVAVAALTLIEGQAPSPWVALVFALPLARPVLVRLVDWVGHGELLVLLGVLLALVVGGLGFSAVGLSGELGAVLVGALLADHPRANELYTALWSLKEVFLVAFFLVIGLSGLPSPESVVVALALVALLPIKALAYLLVLTRFRLRARSGFLAALTLLSYSEFGLIVAQMGVVRGLVEETWLVSIALAISLSFALAAYVNRRSHVLYERWAHLLDRLESSRKHPDDGPVSLGSAEVLIVGMGRVGTGAYDQLRLHGEKVVGLDSDPGKLAHHRDAGRRVVYGDAEDSGFWHRVRLDGVRAVLLAMPELEAKTLAARQLRSRGFDGLISATNLYPEEAEQILASGCTTTFNYYSEAGVGFAEHTWQALRPAASGQRAPPAPETEDRP